MSVKLEELQRADRLESALGRLPTAKAVRLVTTARQGLAAAADFDSLLHSAQEAGNVQPWMTWEPEPLVDTGFSVGPRCWRGVVPALPEERAPQSAFGQWQDLVLNELKQAGIALSRRRAVWHGFIEMCDNAIYHSATTHEAVFTFEITSDWFEFSVTDTGQGIANSLRTNPLYAGLSDRQAVMEAMKDGVTRVSNSLGGTGFTQLARAVAEFNCGVRIRTGGLSLMWFGEGVGLVESSLATAPHRTGVHVRVLGVQ